MAEITPTRSAYLELREDRSGMEEGYRFLDEKRLVLAAEALHELALYEETYAKFKADYDQAIRALQSAVMRHGVKGVELYPPAEAPTGDLVKRERSVLGVSLLEISPPEPGKAERQALLPSPEAEQCRTLFARLMVQATQVAASAANLQRLRIEYEKTSRRARALEDALLPEIDETLGRLEVALEEFDREEVVRVRSLGASV